MAGVCCAASTSYCKASIRIVRCSSSRQTNRDNNPSKQTPPLLKFAVSGVTEILRLFSIGNDKKMDVVVSGREDELSVSGVDDILDILKADYDNAYFVTGIFSFSIYADDCLFEDPTIKFREHIWAAYILLTSLLVDNAATLTQGADSERDFVLANWSLRTYLKLPWRPLIAIEGSTMYYLNDEYKIIRHVESWSVSALEAVGQIFTPGFRKPRD
ncbi:hypothetical protein Cgig2_000078 [Carnegiea gigantea]|uniref:Uncharacterized protein n=1 Tax=Carnegiea gigantea TaxID=171969 RepID=A0A9Q1QSH1_9CARY|nr:hypothetical protein Cgig2_000078 [Carnegiea gigantea]